jgi:hypothetical protein
MTTTDHALVPASPSPDWKESDMALDGEPAFSEKE